MDNLFKCLDLALQECTYNGEEQGGFIINKGDEYLWYKVANKNSGKPMAVALYTADENEFGSILKRTTKKEGWTIYASFHTHPGNSTTPSTVDLRYLFTNFPRHYIYSPNCGELSRYTITEFGFGFPVFKANGEKESQAVWERAIIKEANE